MDGGRGLRGCALVKTSSSSELSSASSIRKGHLLRFFLFITSSSGSTQSKRTVTAKFKIATNYGLEFKSCNCRAAASLETDRYIAGKYQKPGPGNDSTQSRRTVVRLGIKNY
jgi:hypothetical protein